jgi:ATP adenylyltransferase
MISQAQSPSGEDLWSRVRATAVNAATCGALQPIQTVVRYVEEAGIRFVVRMLEGVAGRAAAQQKMARATIERPVSENPFLPYDPALFVTDLSPTHVCLLNKYPVVNHHLLIVTRAFEEQETLLTQADFEALWLCMRAMDGLAFYNSGKIAGASQRHKHLQLALFPLDPAGVDVPLEVALGTPQRLGEVVESPHLPFRHALVWIDGKLASSDRMTELYGAMLRFISVWEGDNARPKPYNWLATHRWMLAVPRTRESIEGISINALGFAGSFLVKDEAQLEWLGTVGPLRALQAVSNCEANHFGAAPSAVNAHDQ